MLAKLIFTMLFYINVASGYKNIILNRSNLIIIREPITSISSTKIINNLLKVEETDIYVFLNTPGGSVMDGLDIINTINGLQANNKIIHCIGNFVASMGFTIMQTCDYRYALPNAIFMQHQMSLINKGYLNNVKNKLNLVDTINTRLIAYQAYRLNITKERFIELITNDYWIFGEDIKTQLVVDEIVTIKCNYEVVEEKDQIEILNRKINVVYSSCPLVTKPLKIKMESDDTILPEMQTEIDNYFYFN